MASNNMRATVQIKDERDRKKLRQVIMECMANSEIDADLLVANMDKVFKWVTTGRVPGEKPNLKIVGKNDGASKT